MKRKNHVYGKYSAEMGLRANTCVDQNKYLYRELNFGVMTVTPQSSPALRNQLQPKYYHKFLRKLSTLFALVW